VIELAPHHKVGLSLRSPLLTAAGCYGYGVEFGELVDVALFGAVVTNPVSLRPLPGPPQPRVAELNDGIILNTGDQNPGVRQLIRRYAAAWKRLGCPIIVHLAPEPTDDMARTARALATTGAVAALEVGVAEVGSDSEVAGAVGAARESELPVLARLPLMRAATLATACVRAGADALVVAAPPPAAAFHRSGRLVTGRLYGRLVHALVLPVLEAVRRVTDVPLVGCGGVHNAADVRAMLAVGAVAVQLDGVLWRTPWLMSRLAAEVAAAT
jgi:dihydroorotate dehydrogenase (NAD+) catalytic subunit